MWGLLVIQQIFCKTLKKALFYGLSLNYAKDDLFTLNRAKYVSFDDKFMFYYHLLFEASAVSSPL